MQKKNIKNIIFVAQSSTKEMITCESRNQT